jgi:hypothetical protein
MAHSAASISPTKMGAGLELGGQNADHRVKHRIQLDSARHQGFDNLGALCSLNQAV